MAKLYFTFGTMGSSKTAQALIQRFSFIERGKKVLFLKPSIDTRDGEFILKSRIAGLEAPVETYKADENIIDKFNMKLIDMDCIIVDEVQLSTATQIEELRYIVDELNIMVYTYGLRVNFKSLLFEGSKRLMELADEIRDIETPCHCGRKTIVNARYRGKKVLYEGEDIVIGGNNMYKSLCYKCFREGNLDISKEKGEK